MKIKDTLAQFVRTLTGRRHEDEATDREVPVQRMDESGRRHRRDTGSARHPRRDADIPLDRIEGAYTPTQTSLKAPFRADGNDRQRDQEFARGVDDNHWNDEDRFTNKSGDPRIGTHGRTYEPGEARVASPRKRTSEED